jgi:hypothetical protein
MTKTVTLIQFHNHTKDSDDRLRKSIVNKWFILGDMDSSYEFYDGTDDEGEDSYSDLDCLRYYDTFDDFVNETNEGYMVIHGLKYSTIEMELNFDENRNELNWLIA